MLKLPDSYETLQYKLPYNHSESMERAEAFIVVIILSTVAKNAKYMLEDILKNFNTITLHFE